MNVDENKKYYFLEVSYDGGSLNKIKIDFFLMKQTWRNIRKDILDICLEMIISLLSILLSNAIVTVQKTCYGKKVANAMIVLKNSRAVKIC